MKRRNMRDEGLTCITMLAIGLSNAYYIPPEMQIVLLPLMIAAVALSLLVYFIHLPSEQDAEREEQDERNRMIQEKASYYSRQVEDWILLALFIVFAHGFRRFEIAYAFMWFMIGRWWLSFGIRWWLNRKY